MEQVIAKAKAIRLLILDVDGVLTNGVIYYGNEDIELKGFHIHDGLGIKLLQKSGVTVAIISGKKSDAVARRIKDLKITWAYLGHENKLPAYEELKQKLNLKDTEIAYMGDDWPDFPILKRVGLAITVPKSPLAKETVIDLITKKKPGKGAVREACEFILKAQGTYSSVLESDYTF